MFLRRLLACPTVAVLVVFVNNTRAYASEDACQNQTPHWYASPEWWLVIVAIPTLIFIWYQTRETAHAAKATQIAAEASQKSVMLQETALRQWVDIEKWRAVPWIPEGGVLSLNIQFDVVNPTSLPLTLYSVNVGFDGKGGAIAQRNLLPPKNRQTVAMPIKITEEQLLRWKQSTIGFHVSGKVIYEDILKEVQTQPFEGTISLSEKNGAVFMRYLGPGLHVAEKDGD
jgi:hypothetical protein